MDDQGRSGREWFPNLKHEKDRFFSENRVDSSRKDITSSGNTSDRKRKSEKINTSQDYCNNLLKICKKTENLNTPSSQQNSVVRTRENQSQNTKSGSVSFSTASTKESFSLNENQRCINGIYKMKQYDSIKNSYLVVDKKADKYKQMKCCDDKQDRNGKLDKNHDLENINDSKKSLLNEETTPKLNILSESNNSSILFALKESNNTNKFTSVEQYNKITCSNKQNSELSKSSNSKMVKAEEKQFISTNNNKGYDNEKVVSSTKNYKVHHTDAALKEFNKTTKEQPKKECNILVQLSPNDKLDKQTPHRQPSIVIEETDKLNKNKEYHYKQKDEVNIIGSLINNVVNEGEKVIEKNLVYNLDKEKELKNNVPNNCNTVDEGKKVMKENLICNLDEAKELKNDASNNLVSLSDVSRKRKSEDVITKLSKASKIEDTATSKDDTVQSKIICDAKAKVAEKSVTIKDNDCNKSSLNPTKSLLKSEQEKDCDNLNHCKRKHCLLEPKLVLHRLEENLVKSKINNLNTNIIKQSNITENLKMEFHTSDKKQDIKTEICHERSDVNQNSPLSNKQSELVYNQFKTNLENHIKELKILLLFYNKKLLGNYKVSFNTEVHNSGELNHKIFYFEKETDENCRDGSMYFISPTVSKENIFNLFIQYLQKDYKTIRNITVYSDLQINDSALKNDDINIVSGESKSTYKIIISENSEFFNHMLKKVGKQTSCISALSKLIKRYIISKEKVVLNGLIKKYHMALIRENVIKVKTKKENSTTVYRGQFTKKFIEGCNLSKPAKELRSLLKQELGSLTPDLKLNLTERFGNDFIFDENPIVMKLENLAKALVTVISSSIKMPKSRILIRKDYTIKQDINKITKHILKKDDNDKDTVVFTKKFLDCNMILPGNLNLLRDKIKHKLLIENLKFDQLDKCKFKINNFQDRQSKDIIINFSLEDSSVVKDFLNKIEFVDMINSEINLESDLQKISNEFEFIQSESCLNNVKNKVLTWLQSENCYNKSFSSLKDTLMNLCQKSKNNPMEIIRELNHSNITSDSESKMFNKVKLRSRKYPYKLSDFIDKQTLFKLTKGNPNIFGNLPAEEVIIGKDLTKPSGYDKKYIKNKLKQHVILSHEIFKNTNDNVFIITNINRSNFLKYLPPGEKVHYFHQLHPDMKTSVKYILLGFNEVESNFDIFVEKNRKLDIHLIKYDRQNFIWKRSNGSITALCPYTREELVLLQESESKQDTLDRCGPNLVIISGESGTGKSTYLYHLAKRWRKFKNLPHWLVQVNLNNSILNAFKKDVIEDCQTINIITKLLGYNEINEKLFELSVNGKTKLKVVMFFDGFEELNSENAKFMIKLLKHLKNKNIEKIYVTTRPNLRSKLESELGVFSFSLDLIAHDKKVEFLIKYWSNESQFNHNLNEHAQNLLNKYSNETGTVTVTETNNADLTSTPLHLRMLAEIYKHDLQNNNNECTIDSLYSLYEKFVSIFTVDVSKLESISCKRLSLTDLISEDITDMKDFTYEVCFDHITFAEYFAAQAIKKKCDSDECYTMALDCIDRLIENASPVFFSAIVATTKVYNSYSYFLSLLINNNNINFLKALLTHKLPDYSTVEVTPLHIAVQKNDFNIVKLLLDCHNDTGTDEIFEHGIFKRPEFANCELVKFVNKLDHGRSAIQMAADEWNFEIASELILMGADLANLDEDYLQQTTLYVVNEIAKINSSQKHKFYSIVEKLFMIEPQVINYLDKDKCSLLLSFFFKNGRVEVIKCLFKILNNETNKGKVSEDNYKKFLDYVNANTSMSDMDRLDIVKFVVEKVGFELSKKKKYYLWPVLLAAIESEHTKTFEYFIDQYPHGYVGFLKQALESDKLKAIEFLMRDNKRTLDPNNNHNTVLQTALRSAINLKTIKFIVDKGGIHNKNSKGENALCVAIKKGSKLQVIEYLIEQHAKVNEEDNAGLFPWCYAILEDLSCYNKDDQLSIMRLLKQRNCDIVVPKSGKSSKCDRWIKEIEKKLEFFDNYDTYDLNFEQTGECKRPRLHSAIKDLNWCKFLIVQGADVNVTDSQGRTPLHIAIDSNCYDVAKILLQHGATFDVTDHEDQTPLDLLLKKDPEHCNDFKDLAKCRDKLGRTLQHVAANIDNSIDVFRKLINFNRECHKKHKTFPRLDLNVQDDEGNTPIHLAVIKDRKELVALLLSKGARFDIENKEGKTLSSLAAENGFHEIEQLLDSVKGTFEAIVNRDLNRLIENMKHHTYSLINARDNFGRTPLIAAMQAFKSDNTEVDRGIIKYLAEREGVFVDAADFYNKTALHYAIEYDNVEGMRILLTAGAMIDTECENRCKRFESIGKECKSIALLKSIYDLFAELQADNPNLLFDERKFNLEDRLSDIERRYQIDRKVVVNLKNCNGRTLLYYAKKYKYPETAKILQKCGAN